MKQHPLQLGLFQHVDSWLEPGTTKSTSSWWFKLKTWQLLFQYHHFANNSNLYHEVTLKLLQT